MANNLKIQRNHDLFKAYHNLLSVANGNFITHKTAVHLLMSMPAPRFYITPKTARYYIKGIFNPKEPNKQALVADLIDNYQWLITTYPQITIEDSYERVVLLAARSFYLTERAIKGIIFNYDRKND